jgi:YVTN family beta-propeller protein
MPSSRTQLATALALGAVALSGCGSAAGVNAPALVQAAASTRTHPTGNVVTQSSVANAPYGIAISAKGKIYVTRIASNTLAFATGENRTFSGSITVGTTPAHVVFNPLGTRAYVTNQSSNSVSVVDVATAHELAQIPLDNNAFNLIVTKDGKKVFATTASGKVYVINTATNLKVDSLQLPPVTNGLALSPSGNTVYISSRDGGTVTSIDTRTHAVLGTLTTGGRPQRLAVSLDGKEIYIANEDLGLDIWSLTTKTRITSVAMDAYGLGLTPDGVQVYVSGPLTGIVTIVDRVSRQVVKTLPVGGRPRNIVFNTIGRLGLVSNEYGWVNFIE